MNSSYIICEFGSWDLRIDPQPPVKPNPINHKRTTHSTLQNKMTQPCLTPSTLFLLLLTPFTSFLLHRHSLSVACCISLPQPPRHQPFLTRVQLALYSSFMDLLTMTRSVFFRCATTVLLLFRIFRFLS